MIAVDIGDENQIGLGYAIPASLRGIDNHHLAAGLNHKAGMHHRGDLQWPGSGLEFFYITRGEGGCGQNASPMQPSTIDEYFIDSIMQHFAGDIRLLP